MFSSIFGLAKEIIAIDSSPQAGTLKLAQWLGGLFKKLNFRVNVQRHRHNDQPQANLVARLGPLRGGGLMLNTHLDTVPAGNPAAWTMTQGNPLMLTHQGQHLYGLGVADTKLALACQILALKSLDLSRIVHPLIVTGTYGEELGLIGIRDLMKKNQLKPMAIINSEPTELLPARGNRGFAVYEIFIPFVSPPTKKISLRAHHVIAAGKSAHSSTPWLGINAILRALETLPHIEGEYQIAGLAGGVADNVVPAQCEFYLHGGKISPALIERATLHVKSAKEETNFFVPPSELGRLIQWTSAYRRLIMDMAKLRDDAFDPPQVTTSVNHMSMTREGVLLRLDIRTIPGLEYTHLQRYVAKMGNSLSHGGPAVTYQQVRADPPFLTSMFNPVIRRCQTLLESLGRQSTVITKVGCTEASLLSQWTQDIVTIGPGRSLGNSHAPNECVAVKDLEDAVQFYRDIIQEYCF